MPWFSLKPVPPTDGLDPGGQEIRVVGTGFNENQGIYISVCVDNGPGELPTPCLGGIDTEGASGSAAWISSNPPSYAEGLTTPYGPGGSFDVTLFVVASDPKVEIDCFATPCAVVTRSDHTATEDRSQDTITPLSFAEPGSVPTASPTSPDEQPGSTPTASEEAPTASATDDAEPTTADDLTPTTEGVATGETDAADDTDDTDDTDEGGFSPALWAGVAVAIGAGVVAAFVIFRRSAQDQNAASGDPQNPSTEKGTTQ
jgi:hypothetical protein